MLRFFLPVLGLVGVVLVGLGGLLATERASQALQPVIAYLHEECTQYSACSWNPAVHYTSPDGADTFAARPNDFNELDIAWSPDGEHVVFVSDVTSARPRYSLQLASFNGTATRQLTEGAACQDDFPRWSPAGDRIAFVRRCHGAFSENLMIYDMGQGTTREVFGGPLFFGGPVWLPNGEAVLLAIEGDDNFDIVRVELESGTLTNLNPGGVDYRTTDPVPDPSGRRIAFRGWQDFEQWIMVLDTVSGEQTLVSGPRGFAIQQLWAPDGEWLYYIEQDFDYRLMRVRPDGRSLQALLVDAWAPTLSPDGEHFALLRNRSTLTVIEADGDNLRELPTPPGNTILARWVTLPSRDWSALAVSGGGLLAVGLALGVQIALTKRDLTA